jgi:hypothetical protein
MALGIPAMIVGTSHKEPFDVPTHVLMAFQDDLDDWVKMDGTTPYPVGRIAPHVREWWVEPGRTQKDKGVGDFVGMSGAETSGGSLDAPPHVVDLVFPGIR